MPDRPLRILVVEDNPGDFFLLKEHLGQSHPQGWSLQQAKTLAEARTLCTQQDFDLILLDLGLPDSQGLSTFQHLSTHASSLPIIILSGHNDDALALEAVQYGAQDYIFKNQCDGVVLYRAIRYAIERKNLEMQIREKEERYRLLTENMVDVIWQVGLSPGGKMAFEYLSPSMIHLLGYTPEEACRLPMQALMTPRSWDILTTNLREHAAALGPEGKAQEYICFDLEQIHKDGSRVWTETRAKTLRGSQGRLIGAQGVTRDISERKRMEQKLEEMSFTDSLTGLYSRRFFEQELLRFQDGRHLPLGLIICDIDNLKMVNDQLGHELGDQLICQAADLLQHSLRQSDIVARIGGDEFAVLLPATSQETLTKVCARIRFACPAHLLPHSGLPVSLSLGFALAETAPVDTRRLHRLADNAMYADKREKPWSRCRNEGSEKAKPRQKSPRQ